MAVVMWMRMRSIKRTTILADAYEDEDEVLDDDDDDDDDYRWRCGCCCQPDSEALSHHPDFCSELLLLQNRNQTFSEKIIPLLFFSMQRVLSNT